MNIDKDLDKDLDKFLKDTAPEIKWLAQIGWHYCHGCGRTVDSSEKMFHYRVCTYSKDKKMAKLLANVIAENYPDDFQQSKPIVEVPLEWYKNQIKVNANLTMDFKPTGSPIDE